MFDVRNCNCPHRTCSLDLPDRFSYIYVQPCPYSITALKSTLSTFRQDFGKVKETQLLIG